MIQTGEYGEDQGYGKKQQRHVFDICCLKVKFSSHVTPIFKTDAAGVILCLRISGKGHGVLYAAMRYQ